MADNNPIVERWARLEGHPFDLEAASQAFENNPVCSIVFDDDGHYYLKVPKLYQIEDGWEFKRCADEFLDRVNGAMAVAEDNFQPVSAGSVVPIHANGGKGVLILVGTAHMRMRGGKVRLIVSGQEEKERQPSKPESWITLCEDDDDLTDALTFIGREASWFDLFKAYEVIKIRLGGEEKLQSLLFGSGEQKDVKGKIKSFLHSANTLHRHRNKSWEPPKQPMSLGEARTLMLNLVGRFARWLEEDQKRLGRS